MNGSISSNQKVELKNGMIQKYTALTTGKKYLDIVYDDDNNIDVHDVLDIGESITLVLMLGCSSTRQPYISDVFGTTQLGFEIDNVTQTLVYWQNGIAPTSGSNVGYDVYTITINRISAAGNGYECFVNVSNSAL